MYRFHSATNLIDIIHKFFFLRSRPLQLSLRILFLHFSLTQTTSNVCVLFCFFRTSCFFSRKNYKNIQKNNLVICVCLFFCYFSNPVTTCMVTWRAKRGSARARRIDYRFFCRVCQKSVYPKLQNLATFFLLGFVRLT